MKRERSIIITYALRLFLFTTAVALCLGGVYVLTQEPIRAASEETRQRAMRNVFPDADAFSAVNVDAQTAEEFGVRSVVRALRGADELGYVFEVSTSGFGGELVLLVGVDDAGTVTGMEVTAHSETPGLGADVDTEEFRGAFAGKTGPLSVIKGAQPQGNEISAISGATISTRAVTDAVNAALSYFESELSGGAQ